MAIIVDSENVVNSLSNAPDRLRAETGTYFSQIEASINVPEGANSGQATTVLSRFENFNEGVKTSFIVDRQVSNQTLFFEKKSRIYIVGQESKFRDQDQWGDYIKQTVSTNTQFLDHQFDLSLPESEAGFVVKNFHNPSYEDNTKVYPSNQLLNFNLISYPFKKMSDEISRISDLKTQFDGPEYSVGESIGLDSLLEQYDRRISNYTGSVEEISNKQRHIYDLYELTSFLTRKEEFPFYFEKNLPAFPSSNLNQIMIQHGKLKQTLQYIKKNITFSNRLFRIETDDVSAKLYNLIEMLTSTQIARFSIEEDETFLLPEEEISNSNYSDRFINGVSAVRFLSDVRNFINQNSRDYTSIINSNGCETFFLGYKIEKYLDNDATQPIQTYYTNNSSFCDTQLKYGRKYIYKTKALIGVLGSSYSYSNLTYSINELEMTTEQGETISQFESEYGQILGQKYRAYVDVSCIPSFQILEFPLSEEEVVFEDEIPNAPQVYFYNQPHRPTVEFFLSPMYEDREGIDDRLRMEYFNGVYEIYRLDRPPTSMEDFEDAFLTTIDDQTTLVNASDEIPDHLLENMNGHFEDRLIQNQKYYYAFKAVTYHGTQSEFTLPFEIEMVKDSDEFKVTVSEYMIPREKDYQYERKAKRILKITPNLERLFFSEEESTSVWKLDDANMLAKNQTTKFKIRVTSKHTGKKMDLNLNFFLDDKT